MRSRKNIKLLTRKMLINNLENLLDGKLTYRAFGYIICDYITYKYEVNYEDLISKILLEFIDLHDLGKRNLGFKPYVPSKNEIKKFINLLKNKEQANGSQGLKNGVTY